MVVTENIEKEKNIDFSQYQKFKSRSTLPILVSVLEGSSIRNVKYKDRIVKIMLTLLAVMKGQLDFIILIFLMVEILLKMIFTLVEMYAY